MSPNSQGDGGWGGGREYKGEVGECEACNTPSVDLDCFSHVGEIHIGTGSPTKYVLIIFY